MIEPELPVNEPPILSSNYIAIAILFLVIQMIVIKYDYHPLQQGPGYQDTLAHNSLLVFISMLISTIWPLVLVASMFIGILLALAWLVT